MDYSTRQHALSQAQPLTIPEAAKYFGITPGAVRKRLERRQLQGTKDDNGRWTVFVTTNERADKGSASPKRRFDSRATRSAEHQSRDGAGEGWVHLLLAEIENYSRRIELLAYDNGRYRERIESLEEQLAKMKQDLEDIQNQALARQLHR